ncbi:hypothetical protein INT47_002957 [Mucor saturninus]|uniref:Uncharacterized protein n=1 Tax=Mucor saturninus TaxID=64648 RepID=A0A8H7QFX0_9FUNG|nr:hypothetical protein INT47_002957 [Mucor saturninus]
MGPLRVLWDSYGVKPKNPMGLLRVLWDFYGVKHEVQLKVPWDFYGAKRERELQLKVPWEFYGAKRELQLKVLWDYQPNVRVRWEYKESHGTFTVLSVSYSQKSHGTTKSPMGLPAKF